MRDSQVAPAIANGAPTMRPPQRCGPAYSGDKVALEPDVCSGTKPDVAVRWVGRLSADAVRNWPRAIAARVRTAIAPMNRVITAMAAMAYPVAPGGLALVIHSSAHVIAMA